MRLRVFIFTLLSLLGLCLFPVAAAGQLQTVNLVASHLVNLSGQPVTGSFCITPADNNGAVLGFYYGGGGQGTDNQVCAPVANGVLSMVVPDTNYTNPQ